LPSERPEALRRQKRWQGVLRRWEKLVSQAMSLLTTDEQAKVVGAVEQWAADFAGPLACWLSDLYEGRCRLPLLPAAAMKAVLLAWLSPAAEGGMVCVRCGLEYPRHKTPPLGEWKVLPGKRPQEGPPPWFDLPEFFSSCPGCAASVREADWPHLTEQSFRPWKELDGFVG
jgi:hypothetical protein